MTRRDIAAVVPLAWRMHRESRYSRLDFDPAKVAGVGLVVVANPETWLGLVAEKNGEIVGMLIGFVEEHFFGRDRRAGDLAVYVDKPHRKGMVGVALVKGYLAWARDRGAADIYLGVSAGIDAGRIGRLYERLGLTEKYTVYRTPAI